MGIASTHTLSSDTFTMQDRVIGILDWELSTLGNQMCDVAYSSLVNVQILVFGQGISLVFLVM